LSIGNATNVDRSISLVGMTPVQAFQVTALRLPAGASAVPRLVVNSVGELTGRGTRSPVEWAETIEIAAGGSVTWKATLVLPATAARGVYELQIVPTFGVADGSLLRHMGPLVRYERRSATTVADRAEVLRRNMMHAYSTGSDAEASAAANALLRVYPQSSLAYQVEAATAKRRGEPLRAIEAFQHAVDLIERRQDVLYIAQASNAEINQSIQAIRQAVQVLQKQP
jgi:hypothetical protein